MTETTEANLTTATVRGRIAGVEVTVTLTIPVAELKERLAEVLEQLTELGVEVESPEVRGDEGGEDRSRFREHARGDEPLPRLARELDVDLPEIGKILGIKGEQVDLFRAGRLKVADALSAMCFAYEKGLGRSGMSYETFKSLVDANQIKMKTPLPTVCFNLIQSGRISRKEYDDSKIIVLTPEGERKAADTLRALMAGSARERPAAPRGKTSAKKPRPRGRTGR